ncbi:MAG: ATP-binding protein, partial [Chlamydiia bacterium]|nr:ATP-binding protein [Chlamydiia bacterium]
MSNMFIGLSGQYFGDILTHVLYRMGENLAVHLPNVNSGTQTGTNVNAFIRDFFQNADFGNLMKEFAADGGKNIQEAFKAFNFNATATVLTEEGGAGFNIFKDNFVRGTRHLLDDMSTAFTDNLRMNVIKSAPWLAFGGGLIVGTPLVLFYLYKRAVDSIGRPELAKEVRKVGFLDRVQETIVNTVSLNTRAAVSATKWGALTWFTSFTGCIASYAGLSISNGQPATNSWSYEAIDNFFCSYNKFFESYAPCNTRSDFNPILWATGAAIAGSLFVTYFNAAKRALTRPKNHKPIFSAHIQRRIDNLVKANYNIQRNGGFMQNVLLCGPGGTGKTMIAEFIAKNSGMNYVMMSGADISKSIAKGIHVDELRKFFSSINSSYTPTIVFIDECESLCHCREKLRNSNNPQAQAYFEIIDTFLEETGRPSKQFMLILATNRKEDLDPAVLDRIDHKIEINPPAFEERKKILALYLCDFFTKNEREEIFTESLIEAIAQQTEGFSGRKLQKLCNMIKGLKDCSDDGILTEEMVHGAVKDMVDQNREEIATLPQAQIPTPKTQTNSSPVIEEQEINPPPPPIEE